MSSKAALCSYAFPIVDDSVNVSPLPHIERDGDAIDPLIIWDVGVSWTVWLRIELLLQSLFPKIELTILPKKLIRSP